MKRERSQSYGRSQDPVTSLIMTSDPLVDPQASGSPGPTLLLLTCGPSALVAPRYPLISFVGPRFPILFLL